MSWNIFGNSEEFQAKKIQEKISTLEAEYEQKLNPAQEEIAEDQGPLSEYSSRYTSNVVAAYNSLEVVNRGVNLIADSLAEFPIDVGDTIAAMSSTTSIRVQRLKNLLNYQANPYTSASELKNQMAIDLLIEGNSFVYFDGTYVYSLPAAEVEVVTDKKTFINHYKYKNTKFMPEEIIHTRDNSAQSIFRGYSRINSAVASIDILNKMNMYQSNFFKNNTILGVVLKTDDILSSKLKSRKILEWMRDYNPTSGGRKPLILDGGFEIEDLAKYTFQELDFAESIKTQERKILEAIGVPPILLDSGNNANISPNLRLLYTNTVIPLLNKIITSFELFFGYDLKAINSGVMALRPELREEASYYSTLVNAGVMTRNEAREKLRLPKYEDTDAGIGDSLILPANIAGSAVNPGDGGRPPGNNEE